MINLPKGYREIRRVDLMRNRREAILVNLIALVIAGVATAVGFLVCPPFLEVMIGIHTISRSY